MFFLQDVFLFPQVAAGASAELNVENSPAEKGYVLYSDSAGEGDSDL